MLTSVSQWDDQSKSIKRNYGAVLSHLDIQFLYIGKEHRKPLITHTIQFGHVHVNLKGNSQTTVSLELILI